MTAAWLSLVALAIAIVAGILWRVNIGLLSIALAFLVGVGAGGLGPADVVAGFPTQLFLVLVAVTFLFAQAKANGTLDRLAAGTVRLARGNRGLVPLLIFGFAALISGLGAGNIATTALLAPVAMTIGARLGIGAFLMTIVVANGANAGTFSPVAPTGIVASHLMTEAGLPDAEWRTFLNTFLAVTVVTVAGYLVLGGARLLLQPGEGPEGEPVQPELEPLAWGQRLTLAAVAGLLLAVTLFQVELVVGAFVTAVALALFRTAEEDAVVRVMPWGAILMVCGVTTMVGVLQRTGGLDQVVTLLVQVSTATTVTGVIAFVTGVVSIYSSSIGVVLPAFLPMTAGLADRLGADPMAIASSINVGAHLVDVSPLSTLGALCIAVAPPSEDRRVLFNRVLAWGLSMAVVGALLCFGIFGLL